MYTNELCAILAKRRDGQKQRMRLNKFSFNFTSFFHHYEILQLHFLRFSFDFEIDIIHFFIAIHILQIKTDKQNNGPYVITPPSSLHPLALN